MPGRRHFPGLRARGRLASRTSTPWRSTSATVTRSSTTFRSSASSGGTGCGSRTSERVFDSPAVPAQLEPAGRLHDCLQPEPRPYPFVRNITFAESGGNQSYNALQFEATRRFSSGLAFDAHWTWAKNLTDTPDDNQLGVLLEDGYNRDREWGRESYTPRHRFLSTLLYDLPFGRGRPFLSNANWLANLLVGGWSLSAIVQFQTGGFFTPTFSGSDPSNTNTTSGRADRIAEGNFRLIPEL